MNMRITSAGGDIVGTVPPLPIPATPGLHIDFTGCDFGTPTFLIDWWAVGAAPVQSFDVDVKFGAGPWQNRLNGLDETMSFNGMSGRTDAVRVRACNALGCSAFRQDSMSANCSGDHPPNAP